MTVSPLLKRTYAQPLTLELLAEKVPAVKEGYEAHQTLQKTAKPAQTAPMEERTAYNNLLKTKRLGAKAQEDLIVSALPLIKSLASKEFSRRKAWASRISYDDILQEAIAGFIRGLLSYKPANTQNSATNYLGQWIVTTIRRKLEAMEHDFFIPYEIVERNRRIVAVRSRLASELQREPSDAELLIALNDDSQQPSNKWGRKEAVEENPDAGPKKAKFTQEHIDLSKQLNTKLYAMKSNDVTDNDDDNQLYERSSTTLSASEPASVADVDEESLTNSKYDFFLSVFVAMKIGSQQKDIILRYFGLKPYSEAQNYKDISTNTGMNSRFVKSVITAFQGYMPAAGGVFHYQLLQLDESLVVDLEMDWLLRRLGEWPVGQREPKPAPTALTTGR